MNNLQAAAAGGKKMRPAVLQLIDELCSVYDRRLCDVEEHAPEMLRVIRAVASGGRAVLCSESLVATVLQEEFPGRELLWTHVAVEQLSQDAAVSVPSDRSRA